LRFQLVKIAILIHSAVDNDARVIKQACSLRKAGHEVVIHGIAPGTACIVKRLPGSDIPVLLEPRLSAAAQWRKRLLKVLGVAAGGALLVLASLQILAQAWSRTDQALGWLAVFGLWSLAGGAVYWQRHRLAWVMAHLDDFISNSGRRFGGNDDVTAPPADLVLDRGFRVIGDALMRGLARQPPPDAIHIHDHVALVLAATLKQRYGVPIVWDAHEIYQALADGNRARADKNAAIIAARHSFIDHFITINNSIAGFYREHYPRIATPVVVMNATLPTIAPTYDGCLHSAAGLPATQKILLFQGRFSPHRGLHHLVVAASALRADWTLVMMGWGGLEGELRDLAATHLRAGRAATVFLPGVAQQELQRWSAGASLGVVPYENTGLNHLYCTPNKLWEYPSANVPVLCTDLPEMAAIVTQAGCGFLLPREFDARDIASFINALDDLALATARARCAPFIANNNWTHWERHLLAVYQRIAASET
jgi:glycosyltransferase involved in cell wall biosynthesis